VKRLKVVADLISRLRYDRSEEEVNYQGTVEEFVDSELLTI